MSIGDLMAMLVIFVFFIVYVITMILRFSLCDFPKKVRYIEPYEMKTGDILCISYNNIAGALVGSMTYSAWVHTGMVWVDPITNIRYVLEGAICKQKQYKNFYKIPVSSWLNLNKNSLIGYKSYNGPPVDPYKMIETFNSFTKDVKLEGFSYTWFRFLFKDRYEKVSDYGRKYTCFELTIILGQECGIFKKDRKYSSFFPSHVVNNGIETEKGCYYSDVIQCHQNPMEMKLLSIDRQRFPEFWNN